MGRGRMLRGSLGHTQMLLLNMQALGSKGREFGGMVFVYLILFCFLNFTYNKVYSLLHSLKDTCCHGNYTHSQDINQLQQLCSPSFLMLPVCSQPQPLFRDKQKYYSCEKCDGLTGAMKIEDIHSRDTQESESREHGDIKYLNLQKGVLMRFSGLWLSNQKTSGDL